MRSSLIFASFAAVFLLQSPVQAQQSVADDVIARIEAEGFTVVEVKRSWLGRIVITASDQDDLREVVLNRTSGEVLRDQRFPNEGRGAEQRPEPPVRTPDSRPNPGEPNTRGNPDGPSQSGGPKGGGGSGGKGKGGG